jgi:hypothetical protein
VADAFFELARDGSLVALQRLPLCAGPHLATLNIEQQIHFPPLKTVALQFAVQQILQQAVEARGYGLSGHAFFQHIPLISAGKILL